MVEVIAPTIQNKPDFNVVCLLGINAISYIFKSNVVGYSSP